MYSGSDLHRKHSANWQPASLALCYSACLSHLQVIMLHWKKKSTDSESWPHGLRLCISGKKCKEVPFQCQLACRSTGAAIQHYSSNLNASVHHDDSQHVGSLQCHILHIFHILHIPHVAYFAYSLPTILPVPVFSMCAAYMFCVFMLHFPG